VLFGTGFGATNPVTPMDRISPAANIAGHVVIRIGGVNAQVGFAGLVSPGVYQFNVTIPDIPAGDQKLEVFVDGVAVQDPVFVTIGQP
jgi:uncharacterized protein (TIGR03437 family)